MVQKINEEIMSKTKFLEIKHRFDSISELAWSKINNAEIGATLSIKFNTNINGGIDVTDIDVYFMSDFLQGALGI